MIDISDKIETLRTAIAASCVIAKKETIERAIRGETPKGEVLPVARAAAALAAKKTAELIPYCHPIPLDHLDIQFETDQNPPSPPFACPERSRRACPERSRRDKGGLGGFSELKIRATAKCIAKTGVEMEALVAVSIAALTVYDMLKGIDTEVMIGETRLIEKRGGKSDFADTLESPLPTAVLVTSDSVSSGNKPDKSGRVIVEAMKRFPVDVRHYEIVPDDRERIRQKILEWAAEGIRLILTTGGTGLGPRDVTAEAVRGLIEREVPGIAEAMRSYGQRRTPYAMLSRGVVGVRGEALLVTLPGSSRGVKESIAALFPNVLHIFRMMGGGGHER